MSGDESYSVIITVRDHQRPLIVIFTKICKNLIIAVLCITIIIFVVYILFDFSNNVRNEFSTPKISTTETIVPTSTIPNTTFPTTSSEDPWASVLPPKL